MQTVNADKLEGMAIAVSGSDPMAAAALRLISTQAREIDDLRERIARLERHAHAHGKGELTRRHKPGSV